MNLTNKTLQITIYVDGSHQEYNGNYSTTIPIQFDDNDTKFFVDDDENMYNLNDEPFFSNENGSYCVWKQDTGVWWIGNCEDIGLDAGFAYMKDCKCPWPR